MPRRCRGIRGDAPQGYLFRFAPLRGHRPLRTSNEGAAGQRLSLRRFAPPLSQREAGRGLRQSLRQRFALTPQLRFAAQPSVHPKGTCFAASTGPPHRGRRGAFRACGRGGAMRASPPTKSQGVRRITMGGQGRPPLRTVTRGAVVKRRGDAPQGYLFRFAPLRGPRPLRNDNAARCLGGQGRPPLRFVQHAPCAIVCHGKG